jgi:uncharacterized metal-binding protein YceD (DUF177 family)
MKKCDMNKFNLKKLNEAEDKISNRFAALENLYDDES